MGFRVLKFAGAGVFVSEFDSNISVVYRLMFLYLLIFGRFAWQLFSCVYNNI